MHLASCTDSHHDVTDLVNYETVNNKKTNLNSWRTEYNFSKK